MFHLWGVDLTDEDLAQSRPTSGHGLHGTLTSAVLRSVGGRERSWARWLGGKRPGTPRNQFFMVGYQMDDFYQIFTNWKWIGNGSLAISIH